MNAWRNARTVRDGVARSEGRRLAGHDERSPRCAGGEHRLRDPDPLDEAVARVLDVERGSAAVAELMGDVVRGRGLDLVLARRGEDEQVDLGEWCARVLERAPRRPGGECRGVLAGPHGPPRPDAADRRERAVRDRQASRLPLDPRLDLLDRLDARGQGHAEAGDARNGSDCLGTHGATPAAAPGADDGAAPGPPIGRVCVLGAGGRAPIHRVTSPASCSPFAPPPPPPAPSS